MMRIALGVRQLFGAPGLNAGQVREFGRAGPLPSGRNIEFYFGPAPSFGVPVGDSPKYVVLGQTAILDASIVPETTAEQGPVLEVLSYAMVDVDQLTWAAAVNGDPSGHDKVFALLDDHREAIVQGLDYLAGALGLGLHRQLVLEPRTPDEFAMSLDQPSERLHRQFGSSIEVLESGSVNTRGIFLSDSIVRHAAVLDSFPHWSSTLFWLRRAWNETETRAKFIALFVAVEMLVADVRSPEPADRKAARRAIRKLIKRERVEDVGWVSAALEPRRPTLVERFGELAKAANLPGWEGDATAIAVFNKMRNDLIHRGTRDATHVIQLGDGSTRDLEDIVERYLSYRMFGRVIIYASRFRPSLLELG